MVQAKDISIFLTSTLDPEKTMEAVQTVLNDPYSEANASGVPFVGNAYLDTPFGDSRLDASAELGIIPMGLRRKGGDHAKVYSISGFIAVFKPNQDLENLMSRSDDLSIEEGMSVELIFDFDRKIGLISATDEQELRLLDGDMPEFRAYAELKEATRPQTLKASLLAKAANNAAPPDNAASAEPNQAP